MPTTRPSNSTIVMTFPAAELNAAQVADFKVKLRRSVEKIMQERLATIGIAIEGLLEVQIAYSTSATVATLTIHSTARATSVDALRQALRDQPPRVNIGANAFEASSVARAAEATGSPAVSPTATMSDGDQSTAFVLAVLAVAVLAGAVLGVWVQREATATHGSTATKKSIEKSIGLGRHKLGVGSPTGTADKGRREEDRLANDPIIRSLAIHANQQSVSKQDVHHKQSRSSTPPRRSMPIPRCIHTLALACERSRSNERLRVQISPSPLRCPLRTQHALRSRKSCSTPRPWACTVSG